MRRPAVRLGLRRGRFAPRHLRRWRCHAAPVRLRPANNVVLVTGRQAGSIALGVLPGQAATRLHPPPGPGALMNGWPELDRFLGTDPRDVGCAQAMDMLHVYVDLVVAGAPVEERYPGIAAHLRACGPCGEDFEGLLAAVRGEAH